MDSELTRMHKQLNHFLDLKKYRFLNKYANKFFFLKYKFPFLERKDRNIGFFLKKHAEKKWRVFKLINFKFAKVRQKKRLKIFCQYKAASLFK